MTSLNDVAKEYQSGITFRRDLKTFMILAALIIIGLNLVDEIETYYAVTHYGMVEGNPIMKYMMNNAPYIFSTIIKMGLAVGIVTCFYFWRQSMPYTSLGSALAYIMIFTFVITSNLYAIQHPDKLVNTESVDLSVTSLSSYVSWSSSFMVPLLLVFIGLYMDFRSRDARKLCYGDKTFLYSILGWNI